MEGVHQLGQILAGMQEKAKDLLLPPPPPVEENSKENSEATEGTKESENSVNPNKEEMEVEGKKE
jgi:hypothetical protein